jgi:Fe-S cluster assembly protein SufD
VPEAVAAAPKIEGVTAAFNRDAVERVAASEPEWLRALRLEAWDIYEQTPLPTKKLEEWRYTDVRLLKLNDVRVASADDAAATEAAAALAVDARDGAERSIAAARAALESREASARVLQIGNSAPEIWLDPALAAQGVVLADLREAAETHRDLVEAHLATRAVPATAGKFAALNAALWQSGIFLYVPAGVHFAAPIRVVRWIPRAGIAVLPRTLFIAERGARVALVEEFLSPDLEAPSLSVGAVEAFAGDAAEVQYVALQSWGKGVRHVSMQKTIAGRDAKLDTLVVNLGATVARVDQWAALEGPGARSDMLGLYFASGDQHFDMSTRQDHTVPHATSDLLYKGALYDRSRTIFRGLIKVFPKAQRTDAYQTNRNLLLSDKAEATSLPNLEIEADDVRCSHASTVGQLDDEELFYIMSRGVPANMAERLVVFGFFGDVLDRLPLPGVVEELKAAIAKRIG